MEQVKRKEKLNSEEICIELATIEDLDQIVAICVEGYTRASAVKDKQKVQKRVEEYYYPERILKEIENVSSKWSGWIVARLDEKVIGVIGGGIVDSKVAKISDLYIDPDYLRERIGKRLVDHLTQMQQLLGNHTQLASLFKSNKESFLFYEALGFKRIHDNSDNESSDFTSIEMVRDI
ncbi:GNAT family N-acetyltransferase [Carnobacterium sp. ISL-102]|uniref:GNAT family N-acetyltransferase n=1 Tax=Carnobacterium sp. ISL-102 TaxID=2819142 RepID=UPI001BEB8FF7|nr:GNAT family N-acetyltransferase [Carnobacterium sp. ISL-102]MBT2732134.1 GNAT family N-acetyltransferase [Carnobacterium sp. ISL-102]